MLREAAGLEVDFLLSCLSDLMQRLEAPELSPGGQLKEYMTYVTEVDVEAKAWWPHVPDDLELQHTYQLYALLSDLNRGSV